MKCCKTSECIWVVELVFTAFKVSFSSFTRILWLRKHWEIGSLGHSENKTRIMAANGSCAAASCLNDTWRCRCYEMKWCKLSWRFHIRYRYVIWNPHQSVVVENFRNQLSRKSDLSCLGWKNVAACLELSNTHESVGGLCLPHWASLDSLTKENVVHMRYRFSRFTCDLLINCKVQIWGFKAIVTYFKNWSVMFGVPSESGAYLGAIERKACRWPIEEELI